MIFESLFPLDSDSYPSPLSLNFESDMLSTSEAGIPRLQARSLDSNVVPESALVITSSMFSLNRNPQADTAKRYRVHLVGFTAREAAIAVRRIGNSTVNPMRKTGPSFI
jgi:hypothetical protein